MLLRKNQIPDHTVSNRVTHQMSNRGLRAPCDVSVQVHNGTVTLSGSVQYAYQKNSAMQAARSVEGAHTIIDQMQVIARGKRWD
jgi:osmotically-inducible protein OsmY